MKRGNNDNEDHEVMEDGNDRSLDHGPSDEYATV